MFTILGADGKEYGPVPAAKVQEWITGGRANFQTKARRVDETDWKTLGDYPEFQGAPPPVAPAVFAGTPVPATAATRAPLADRGRRLAGALIDGFLVWLCKIPIMFAALAVMKEAFADPTALHPEQISAAVVGAIPRALPFLGLLAVVQTVLLCVRSQSIGKLILGMRIVSVKTGEPGGLLRAFTLRSLVTWLIEQIPLVGYVFWIVDVCFIFRDDHRCLHDLIAGTQVVKIETAAVSPLSPAAS